ncbi:hypothetical protein CYMTET_38551 [Cymbomonas tetramitiformis]|uniref:Uncharacterized protein n=1 Tax=Cymbomonas tetramitiformis TaxID=36881 RepID=A0AAE0CD21_9CHLO|nr:hypothetical protein CYMTET_38551 [Cymbomonas tetramitiformis]
MEEPGAEEGAGGNTWSGELDGQQMQEEEMEIQQMEQEEEALMEAQGIRATPQVDRITPQPTGEDEER